MSAVITGMGIVSSLGCTLDEVADSLYYGKSGVVFMPERKGLGFRSGLSGAISNFSLTHKLPKRVKKRLPEYGVWTWQALMDALDNAGLEPDVFQGNVRSGIILGNDSSAVAAVEQVEQLKKFKESRYIGSGHIFQLLNSTLTLNFATILGIAGTSMTLSCACASGGAAIAHGAELISKGDLDIAICGGAQEISWESMCSFDALGAFSIREDEPEKASRPFDKERDGLVPSGGAAVVILESEDHAQARGADILASVKGSGYFCDGSHVSLPSGKGLKNAALAALKSAGFAPSDIDLVMAHATSTPLGMRLRPRS